LVAAERSEAAPSALCPLWPFQLIIYYLLLIIFPFSAFISVHLRFQEIALADFGFDRYSVQDSIMHQVVK